MSQTPVGELMCDATPPPFLNPTRPPYTHTSPQEQLVGATGKVGCKGNVASGKCVFKDLMGNSVGTVYLVSSHFCRLPGSLHSPHPGVRAIFPVLPTIYSTPFWEKTEGKEEDRRKTGRRKYGKILPIPGSFLCDLKLLPSFSTVSFQNIHRAPTYMSYRSLSPFCGIHFVSTPESFSKCRWDALCCIIHAHPCPGTVAFVHFETNSHLLTGLFFGVAILRKQRWQRKGLPHYARNGLDVTWESEFQLTHKTFV